MEALSITLSTQQRLQALLEQRVRLEAEIASIRPSTSSHGRSFKHRLPRRQDIPRSDPSLSCSTSGSLSTGNSYCESTSMPTSGSVPPCHSSWLDRFGQRDNTSLTPTIPLSGLDTSFAQGPLGDIRLVTPGAEPSIIHDDPIHGYTFDRPSFRRQPLEQVPEVEFPEESPNHRVRTGPILSVNVSPVVSHSTSQLPGQTFNPHRLSVSQRRQSFGIPPNTPSLISDRSGFSDSPTSSYASSSSSVFDLLPLDDEPLDTVTFGASSYIGESATTFSAPKLQLYHRSILSLNHGRSSPEDNSTPPELSFSARSSSVNSGNSRRSSTNGASLYTPIDFWPTPKSPDYFKEPLSIEKPLGCAQQCICSQSFSLQIEHSGQQNSNDPHLIKKYLQHPPNNLYLQLLDTLREPKKSSRKLFVPADETTLLTKEMNSRVVQIEDEGASQTLPFSQTPLSPPDENDISHSERPQVCIPENLSSIMCENISARLEASSKSTLGKASPYSSHSQDDESESSSEIGIDYSDDEHSSSSTSPSMADFSQLKQTFFLEIMEVFWNTYNKEYQSVVSRCITLMANNSESGTNPQLPLSSPASSSLPAASTTFGSNRKRRSSDDENPEDNHRNPKRPREAPLTPSGEKTAVKFACPYRKYNPRKYNMYQYKTCALAGFESIARMKEHLFRSHRAPIQCIRCWLFFKEQEGLNSHLLAANICERRDGQPAEGLTPTVEKRLRSRKRQSAHETEEDRWRSIYQMLFPEDDVPSPYHEPIQDDAAISHDSMDLPIEEFIRQQVPQTFSRRLQTEVFNMDEHNFLDDYGRLRESFVSRMADMINDAQGSAIAAYRHGISRGTPDSTQLITPAASSVSGSMQTSWHVSSSPPRLVENDNVSAPLQPCISSQANFSQCDNSFSKAGVDFDQGSQFKENFNYIHEIECPVKKEGPPIFQQHPSLSEDVSHDDWTVDLNWDLETMFESQKNRQD